MIRVAFDTTPMYLGSGGVATYTRELRDALRAHAEVDLVELSHGGSSSNSPTKRIVGGLDRELRWYRGGLERAARSAQADVIHVPASLAASSSALPLVLTVHDAIPWRHPEWFTSINAQYQQRLMGRASRAATRITTDSKASATDITTLLGVQESRIDIAYAGISREFTPSLRAPEWLCERFNLTSPVILSVGTPEPRKNLSTVLRTYERVVSQLPKASLLLVGGHGWRNDELDAAIARCPGRVIRAGHVSFSDLTRVYASADCFLFPSLMEGFGFPPLEAMASGLPVVCSNRPSLPEVVDSAAIICDPLDDRSLSEACLSTLSDSETREALRRAGLTQAGHFTWEATAELTVASYRRAMA